MHSVIPGVSRRVRFRKDLVVAEMKEGKHIPVGVGDLKAPQSFADSVSYALALLMKLKSALHRKEGTR